LKLVPYSVQQLRPGEPLPFGLRDGAGRLLFGAGVSIADEDRWQELEQQTVYAEESEVADWNRRLAAAMDAALRQNATLKEVVAARPERARDAATGVRKSLPEEWDEIVLHLDGVLRDMRPDTDAPARLAALHERARALLQRRPDAALYLLIHGAGHSTAKYSSHHALLVMVVCELAAPMLAWPPAALDSLARAALVMNVAMLRLQDQLAVTELALTPSMREEIDGHAAAGAAMLERAGCTDRLAIEVVRLHHDASGFDQPLASQPPARQLARLLRRVDIFTAKLSRRATREPMSPVQAAREACLGPGGVPDEIGQALLKAVGLYPPGSFVELASGELGIVVARGRRANLPWVASLVSASGTPLADPVLRDTLDQRHAVKGAVPSSRVRVRPAHERLLALR
jgi:HD-GYP domain-containing protein (c-di-GMP phosphodiesterase class II)